ncbi:hypothetical protein [Rhizobium sp. Root482]|uniref:hypothetical protein n=1 Tax=Rhizobium sp. Root482 TaxID=1736543 RepID=UPI000AE5D9D4|nr:hypothetical protein [Rhizobium sp. Root482]
MTPAVERRARWNKSCAEATARGAQIESDPRFLEWIEKWITGEIEMATVRERYLVLLGSRTSSPVALTVATFFDEIYDEVPEIAGLSARAHQERHDTTEAVGAAWA